MKKLLATVTVLIVCLCAAFAVNSQKIYSVDSSLYKSISRIYVMTGHAVPSTTGPWSGDELLSMLDVIDRSDVPEELLSTYDKVLSELNAEPSIVFSNGGMEFDGNINLDFYIHSYDAQNSSIVRTDSGAYTQHAFEGRDFWFGKDLSKNVPLLDVSWEAWLRGFFYSYVDFGLQNGYHGDKEIGSTKINSNIFALQNDFQLNVRLVDVNFPQIAFAAVGGNGWTVEIGRDRLNWGSGSTGNLVLADNFPYYDNVRFTAYGEKYKYTYLLAFFPYKGNYYDKETSQYLALAHNSSARILDGTFFYTAHRFEGRLLKDKLSLAITEALVYESETNSIQFAALSPMYFMHNAYMPNNSNSTLAFELNYTPIKKVSLYAQILLDQFAFPGFETAPGPDKGENTEPNGFAAMLGAKYTTGLKGGILEINPEFVYVGAYTYIRDGKKGHGLDYVGAVKSRLYAFEDISTSDIAYDEFVIGYQYGPDCVVANLDLSWENEKLSLGANALFMAHGTNDIWTKWRKVPAHTSEEDFKNQFSAPTSSAANTENYRYPASEVALRNTRWITMDFGARCSYEFTDALSLNMAFDLVAMKGVFNHSGSDAMDVQMVLGGKYSFM
ncbi:MAG: capsule assembly Wzi family protein [Sphaerochaetaceae bacterium]|nr:capsule assembly Wzi family protein [Sphaerochaetaceae bacterium]